MISLIFFSPIYSFSDEIKNRNNFIQKGDKITTRGSGGKVIKVKINPGKDIEIFNSNLKKKTKLKNYTKLLSNSLTKVPKRIKTRGAGNKIYKKYAKSVVYIGNFTNDGVGSGFLIDKPGIIITNWHVVDKADEVAVWTLPTDDVPSEKRLFEELDPIFGSVIAINKKEDLAIVKVGNFPEKIEPVKVGSIKEIQR